MPLKPIATLLPFPLKFFTAAEFKSSRTLIAFQLRTEPRAVEPSGLIKTAGRLYFSASLAARIPDTPGWNFS